MATTHLGPRIQMCCIQGHSRTMRQTLGSPVLAPTAGRTQRLEWEMKGRRAERAEEEVMESDRNADKQWKGRWGQAGWREKTEEHRFSSRRNEKRKNKKERERVKQRGRKGKTPKKPETKSEQRIMGPKVMASGRQRAKKGKKEN